MKTTLLPSLFCLLAAVQAVAEAPLRHELRLFTLPKAEAMSLLADDLDDKALLARMQGMPQRLHVITSEALAAGAEPGDETTFELRQADEFHYPTEFDPQQLPQTLAFGDSKLVALINKLLEPEEEPKTGAAPVQRHPVNGGLGLITSITPTAFEKRDLGDVIRLSAAGDLNWQQARLAGLQNFNGELQAQFSTREMNAGFRLVPGGTVFLGTLSGAEKTGSEFESKSETVSLAFLTSRSLPMAEGENLAKEAKDVQARLEVISVPKSIAAALMDEALNDSLLYSKLQNSPENRLDAIISGRVKLNEEAELIECEEFRYAIEFDPPQQTRELVIADDALLEDLRAGRQTGTPPSNPHNGGFGLQTTATPIKFDMRRLGTLLQIEVRRNETELKLKARAELSRQIGQRRFAGVEMPVFGAPSLQTVRPARCGIPLLLGTISRAVETGLRESEQEDRVAFAFVTLRE
ncbi:MAG: hypothetical protein U1F81_19785 [Verrucomicrobiaceae bacterium]